MQNIFHSYLSTFKIKNVYLYSVTLDYTSCYFYITLFWCTHAQLLGYNIDCFGYINIYTDTALASGSYINGTAILNQGTWQWKSMEVNPETLVSEVCGLLWDGLLYRPTIHQKACLHNAYLSCFRCNFSIPSVIPRSIAWLVALRKLNKDTAPFSFGRYLMDILM